MNLSELLAEHKKKVAEKKEATAPVIPATVKPKVVIDFDKLDEFAEKQSQIPEPIDIDKLRDDYATAEESDYDLHEYDAFADAMGDEEKLDRSAFDLLTGIDFELDESQQKAIERLHSEQAGCLIGAAGTGKTTTTKFLLNLILNGDAKRGIAPLRLQGVNLSKYRDQEVDIEQDQTDSHPDLVVPSICLCAFTGQATQVIKKHMPASWHGNVMTVHSMLQYAPTTYENEGGESKMIFEPTYTWERKMPWDVIVVDEASMVDLRLWHEIRAAAKPECRFYFIGDINQLTPPMGPGILGFALARLPVAELTHVHRQKDEAANRIVDTAWRVLQGREPEFDDPKETKNWRVIGMELEADPLAAHKQIAGIARGLSGKRVDPSVDPASPQIYDPWRDRILTANNGYNPNAQMAYIGQAPLNESLAGIFRDPDHPRIVIDSGIQMKRFAEGFRVMATVNESPNMVNRVTNGQTGKITSITVNPNWVGDRAKVGPEDEVREALRKSFEETFQGSEGIDDFAAADMDFVVQDSTKEQEGRGDASHRVTVKFDNGATRTYSTKAGVQQLQLAYASTVHKSQGSEMPTAIVILHHTAQKMLSRELLYTAVTRASERLVILYTRLGMRQALHTQKIFGATMEEKIQKFLMLGGGEDGNGVKIYNVRITFEEEMLYHGATKV